MAARRCRVGVYLCRANLADEIIYRMKRFISLVSLLVVLQTMAIAQTTTPDWENPQVVGINKLPYHASLQLPSREAECPEIVSLDGLLSN